MRLLLLAGTGEARALAAALAGDARVAVTASLAGATRAPPSLGVATRTGGFGGEAEQEKYIKENGIDAILDATHPFAVRISRRSQALAARLGLPYLQLLRPGWQAAPGDRWSFIDRPEDLAALVPPGAAVFVASGRTSLEGFATLADRRLFCRVIDPPTAPFPFAGGAWVVGRPPFSLADETDLLRRLGVDLLVVKDAGGARGRAKLDAARALGLPVALLRRPAQPPGDKAETVEAALAWLEARL